MLEKHDPCAPKPPKSTLIVLRPRVLRKSRDDADECLIPLDEFDSMPFPTGAFRTVSDNSTFVKSHTAIC